MRVRGGTERAPGTSWARHTRWTAARRRSLRALSFAVVAALVATAVPAIAATRDPGPQVTAILRARPGAVADAASAVAAAGGSVVRRVETIDGLVVRVPASSLPALEARGSILQVTPDAPVRLHSSGETTGGTPATLQFVASAINARNFPVSGVYGAGVDVALIDSGVGQVNGLTAPGKVVNGPDISFESQDPDRRYIDTYGHGTHMAGIIAGLDDTTAQTRSFNASGAFVGIAPDARVLSVKVAGHNGATDVSQVVAAIDWVVQHRNDNGLNVRVLALAFGTDGAQDYRYDPLVHAAEVAWRAGIVVVAAAGNEGTELGRLSNPGLSPNLLTVAAGDPKGTVSHTDDVVPGWSSRGNGVRNPDVVAPGLSVVSLMPPDAQIAADNPGAWTSGGFRGSGTSQAAAVVAGAAALLISHRPSLTPDQVKRLLRSTARSLGQTGADAQGRGLIDLAAASRAAIPTTWPTFTASSGTGTIEGARGSHHVTLDGVALTGEQDIFGTAWDGASWAQAAAARTSWNGGSWRGNIWTGDSWSGTSWTGDSWAGSSWYGNSWTGSSWYGNSWTGSSWYGNSWTGNSWTSAFWK